LPERGARKRLLATIPGTVPNLLNPPQGCMFEERCPEAHARCCRPPPAVPADGDDGHLAACWLYAPEGAGEAADP
jgi:peptide/nickel transport system ATP-binding protein